MTDVLAPVFIPYARFLEVRARRLDIVTAHHSGDGEREAATGHHHRRWQRQSQRQRQAGSSRCQSR